jgi:5-methylcytosine-specific restriction endonuclease McrA
MEDFSRTLMLTPWMAPHEIISWQRAVVLVWLGKVDVLEHYEELLWSPSWSLKAPAVVRLRKPVHAPKPSLVRFTRRNVYGRDDYTCQYCGVRKQDRGLSYDHVVPRVKGGKTTWENIVTACHACNDRKGGRTPDEASMKLLRKPFRPRALPVSTPPGLEASDLPAPWSLYCGHVYCARV